MVFLLGLLGYQFSLACSDFAKKLDKKFFCSKARKIEYCDSWTLQLVGFWVVADGGGVVGGLLPWVLGSTSWALAVCGAGGLAFWPFRGWLAVCLPRFELVVVCVLWTVR